MVVEYVANCWFKQPHLAWSLIGLGLGCTPVVH